LSNPRTWTLSWSKSLVLWTLSAFVVDPH
jgi:hypothetical protein